MKPRLLTSPAELRRQHDTELREITEQIDYYLDRVRSLKSDLAEDLPDSRNAQARLATAVQNLEMAIWLMRGARLELR